MVKEQSTPETFKADGVIDKKIAEEPKGTLYVFPNYDGDGKTIKVVAKYRNEAIKKAAVEYGKKGLK